MSDEQPVSTAIAKKIAAAPPHVRAGLEAYRKALSRRQDWHTAVTAAIDAAVAHKENPPDVEVIER